MKHPLVFSIFAACFDLCRNGIEGIAYREFQEYRGGFAGFFSGVNCFVGRNGAGKTNVLDAVYHLSMCKSFFGLPDGQHIRHGEAFFVVQGKYERNNDKIEVYCGVRGV